MTGLDWDQRTQQQGIYRIAGKGHHGWSRNVGIEFGNYDYLLGVDVRPSFRPSVRTSELIPSRSITAIPRFKKISCAGVPGCWR